jgi:O-antigen ligase
LNPNYKQDRAATGFSYDPNDIALTLVMVLPIIYYLMLEARGWHRWLLLATISTVFYILPMTGSRGGILAFIIVIVLILLKHGIKRLFYLVPVFFLVLFMAFSNSQHLDRYIGITDLSSDYNMDSKFGRIEIWKRTAQLMLNNPLLGCGAGVVSVAEGATHTGKWMTSHNSFLQIGAELGLGGLILHLWIIRSMILLWRKESGALGKGIEVGLYAYCAGGFFLSWAYAYTFYFFVALSIAMARIQAGGGPSTTPTHMKRKFGVHPIDEKVAQP